MKKLSIRYGLLISFTSMTFMAFTAVSTLSVGVSWADATNSTETPEPEGSTPGLVNIEPEF